MITNTSWRIKKMIKKYNPHDRSTWPSNPDQKKKAMEEPFGDALRRVRSKKDVKNSGAREILKSIKPSNIDEYEKVVKDRTLPKYDPELDTTTRKEIDVGQGVGSLFDRSYNNRKVSKGSGINTTGFFKKTD